MSDNNGWDKIITPRGRLLAVDARELWEYRDLVMIFVKRDFVTQYKQTILGPAWAIIKPLLTTVVFTIFFGNLAKLTTADIADMGDTVLPSFLFYLLGAVVWEYFASVVTETSQTFQNNQMILGKVYFPRLIMPISIAVSKLTSLGIQLVLFTAIYVICVFNGMAHVTLSWTLLLFPVLLLQMMILGTSFGMLISALTVKYRDIAMMLNFFMQLWRYGSPLAYGLMLIPARWQTVYLLNPLTPIVAEMRTVVFGAGYFSWTFSLISWITVIALAVISLAVFNKMERNLIDTV